MIGKNLTISGPWISLYCASDISTSGIYEKLQQIRAQAIRLSPYVYYGTPGWIRTSDLQLRRLTPYPLGYGRSGVRSQAASFGPEPCFRLFKILDIAATMPPVLKTLKPCSEPKPTTCERTPSDFECQRHLWPCAEPKPTACERKLPGN